MICGEVNNVISTLNNCNKSKFYISTQFKLVVFKVWTYNYILLGIDCYFLQILLSKYHDAVVSITHLDMNNE